MALNLTRIEALLQVVDMFVADVRDMIAKESDQQVAPERTSEQAPAPQVELAEATVVAEAPMPAVVAEAVVVEASATTPIEAPVVAHAPTDILPVPEPHLFKLVQEAPIRTASEMSMLRANMRNEAAEVIATKNFRDMGRVLDSAKALGFDDVIQKLEEAFAVLNCAQATRLRDDRDATFKQIKLEMKNSELETVTRILHQDLPRIGERFKFLNHHARKQFEVLEGTKEEEGTKVTPKPFADIQREFFVRCAELQTELDAHRQDLEIRTASALTVSVDEKELIWVHARATQFISHMANGNDGGAQKAIACLRMQKNAPAVIAYLGSTAKYQEVRQSGLAACATLLAPVIERYRNHRQSA